MIRGEDRYRFDRLTTDRTESIYFFTFYAPKQLHLDCKARRGQSCRINLDQYLKRATKFRYPGVFLFIVHRKNGGCGPDRTRDLERGIGLTANNRCVYLRRQ